MPYELNLELLMKYFFSSSFLLRLIIFSFFVLFYLLFLRISALACIFFNPLTALTFFVPMSFLLSLTDLLIGLIFLL